jgi:hypothetical protein
VTEVEFFNDTVSLGIDTSAPYGVTWSNVQAGRYTIIARARDNNGAVASSSATVTVDTLLPAVADAYVRDGSTANTNFGNATSLEVRTSGAGNNRWTYLRFDTTGLTSIGSARLRLFGSLSATALMSLKTAVYGAPNTTWGEPTLTWNNKPASGSTALASVTMANSTAGRWYEWDITSYVRQEKAAGRHVITLVLKNTTSSVSNATFSSKEAGAANAPRLAVAP